MCKCSLLICFSRVRCLFNWGSVGSSLHFGERFQRSVQILTFSLFSHFGRSTLDSVLWNRFSVCLSACLSVRPSVTKFSQYWIDSFFLIFYMMIADHDTWLTEPDFWKKNLLTQNWAKWAEIGPKTRFFCYFPSLVH